MHVCTECGRVCEEDMDFCPACGSKKGANIDPALIPPNFKVVSNSRGTFIMRQNVLRIRAALFLALLPGIVDVFGLGHLVMKRWFTGLAFLSFSALYYYERITGHFGMGEWYLFGFTMAVFVVQALDIFRIIRKELGL